MRKLILGFVGYPASGKGAAAHYLKQKYGASTYRFSSILRSLLKRLYLPESRDNLIKMSECVREEFGQDMLAKVMAKDVEYDSSELIIVEGIRRAADIVHLRTIPNFILVEIAADIRTRFERLKLRSENSDDAGKTFEQFLADHERPTEVSIAEVVVEAKEKINNDGNENEFQKQLDELIKKYTPVL